MNNSITFEIPFNLHNFSMARQLKKDSNYIKVTNVGEVLKAEIMQAAQEDDTNLSDFVKFAVKKVLKEKKIEKDARK